MNLRGAWLCGAVLFLEGYDIAAVGYAVPSLVDAWKVRPQVFTGVLTAGNIGLLVGSVCAGVPGDRLGRKPVLIACTVVFGVFSLLSALAGSPSQLAGLRFLTGLGLGGGIPIAIALASDLAPAIIQGRLMILIGAGVPIGFAAGGLLASRLVGPLGWPAIFVTGGVLPIALVPLLVLWLPRSVGVRAAAHGHNLVAALFQNGLAPTTVLLWAINLFSLLAVYFILQWTPAILHSAGVSPARAILGTTMYSLGVIVCPLVAAPIVDRLGMERVLTCGLTFGAFCVLSIGLFDPRFWLLAIVLFGAGIGGGCQAGINSLSALAYPATIRSTGAGWALGAGRIGTIAGPLSGGVLMTAGFSAQKVFIAAAFPVFAAAVSMVILGRLRRSA
ncbi:MAG TPA: MFS transporter [Vicinamibacterales bacterium]|jgi:AAHS family 4-hydroxybenzoate transporter-like MFS transporter|nr:MFS transporter [Vicinamibacterales bacterium]